MLKPKSMMSKSKHKVTKSEGGRENDTNFSLSSLSLWPNK